MYLLVYDIDTTNADGERRLRQVAKYCEKKGSRVQDSVFELLIDRKEKEMLTQKIERIINPVTDSVRVYRLGTNWKSRIECVGKPLRIDYDDVLIL